MHHTLAIFSLPGKNAREIFPIFEKYNDNQLYFFKPFFIQSLHTILFAGTPGSVQICPSLLVLSWFLVQSCRWRPSQLISLLTLRAGEQFGQAQEAMPGMVPCGVDRRRFLKQLLDSSCGYLCPPHPKAFGYTYFMLRELAFLAKNTMVAATLRTASTAKTMNSIYSGSIRAPGRVGRDFNLRLTETLRHS